MSNRKKFSEEEIKTIGLRIRACRVLTGLTQEEFGMSFGLPVPSLKTWEFGVVIPRLDGLKKFCDILRSFGIVVTADWILFGFGTGPSYFLSQPSLDNKESSNVSTSGISIFNDIFEQSCKKNKENPIIVEVDDDEMSPYYNLNDIIGGILLEKSVFQNLNKKPVLVKLENSKYAPRFLQIIDDDCFIYSLKTSLIKKVNLESFAFIKWHYSV